MTGILRALVAVLLVTHAVTAQQSPSVPAEQRRDAAAPEIPRGLDALSIQVALDRAGFSPGVIDGRNGPATRSALDAYRSARAGEPPPAVEALARYRLTPEDVNGPFEPHIPADLVQQAKLETLGYRDALEALAERFHTTPALLKRLNPRATFTAGDELIVPNVEPMLLPAVLPKPAKKLTAADKKAQSAAAQAIAEGKPAVTVTVSKRSGALTVTDAAGRVLMYAPVTTGSDNDPLPIGTWKVNGVSMFPPFRYNPDLFWDADPSHTRAVIPPGPNNPVGVVWIDISKEHYGLHGTPEPQAIGRTQSHGCVRLTNWDALRLAALVKPGTAVVFRE